MKRFMLLSSVLATALATFLFAGAASALPTAPEWLRVRSATADGSGCPRLTSPITVLVSPDNLALTVIFPDFDAQVDPTVVPGISNPNEYCTIAVLLDYPPGFSYSLLSVDYLGHADLGEGTYGIQTSSYWFQGGLGWPATFSTSLAGPFLGPYTRHDELATAAMVWSRCGLRRFLFIDADVSVSNTENPSAKAYMNLKIGEFSVEQTYGITWRRCR